MPKLLLALGIALCAIVLPIPVAAQAPSPEPSAAPTPAPVATAGPSPQATAPQAAQAPKLPPAGSPPLIRYIQITFPTQGTSRSSSRERTSITSRLRSAG